MNHLSFGDCLHILKQLHHNTGTGYESDFPKIQICTVEQLMKNHLH